MRSSHRRTISPHAAASRACLGNLPQMLGFVLFQLALRAVALTPFVLSAAGLNPLGFPPMHATSLSLLACFPLYLILVLPFRFHAGALLVKYTCVSDRRVRISLASYFRWLAAGLMKAMAILPYMLPLAAFLGAFYYFWNMVGFNVSGTLIKDMGAAVGGGYKAGIAVVSLLFAFCLLLALFGWRRHLPLEFQPVAEVGLRRAWARARSVRRGRGAGLARVTLINALICLPALAAAAAVLEIYVSGMLIGDPRRDLRLLLTLLTTFRFPASVVLGLSAILVLLYLPFVCIRKAALACAIERATGDRNSHA